jgi:hypothetical protein
MKSINKILLLMLLSVGFMAGYAPAEATPPDQMKVIVIGSESTDHWMKVAEAAAELTDYTPIVANWETEKPDEPFVMQKIHDEFLELCYFDEVPKPTVINRHGSAYYKGYISSKIPGRSQIPYHNKLC